VGLQFDRNVGVIVLSNETNVGLPDAIGAWTFDRLMGNPLVDYAADALKRAKTKYADDDKQFARPASPRPFHPFAPLAGNFANPSFGKMVLRPEGDALVLKIKISGAKLKLDPSLPAGKTVPFASHHCGDRRWHRACEPHGHWPRQGPALNKC
jgi:hypothetical protein